MENSLARTTLFDNNNEQKQIVQQILSFQKKNLCLERQLLEKDKDNFPRLKECIHKSYTKCKRIKEVKVIGCARKK